MEFPFNCDKVMNSDIGGYATIDDLSLRKLMKMGPANQVIDTFGELSAKSQGLKNVITTTKKVIESNNRIYMKTEGNKVIGFIKVGKKNLFIRNNEGRIFEIEPLCVLDFYTYESVQRSGYGKVYIFLL